MQPLKKSNEGTAEGKKGASAFFFIPLCYGPVLTVLGVSKQGHSRG
jgi:hypothetical protein